MASKLLVSGTKCDNSDDLLYQKKGDVYCGYRRDYLAQNLTKMEEGFVVCKKCKGVMRQASLSNGETSCLVCSTTPKKLNPVKAVQDSIEVLELKCPLLRDCDWKGKLSEAENHLKDCLYFLVQCKTCKQVFLRIEKVEHEENYCPHRIVRCEYCNMEQAAVHRNSHFESCEKYPIVCPNKCGVKFRRQKLFLHRSECELENIYCPYTRFGCKAKPMLRRDLLVHKKENIVEHTDMSLVKIQQMETDYARLKEEQIEMKWKAKELDGVEWCIDFGGIHHFEEIEGPTFYVNDYKLKVFAKERYADSDYVASMCLYLKRIVGEFDKKIGEAFITHYRVIIFNKQGYSKSDYEEGRMDYRLKVGSKSKEIIVKSQSGIPSTLTIRLYFDINTT